jgi:hypothetical protein
MASWARLLVIRHRGPFRAKTNDRPIGQISPIAVRALHIMSAELTKTACDNLHGERILHLPPVVLLKTLGKCAGFRAKCAHISSGHLPVRSRWNWPGAHPSFMRGEHPSLTERSRDGAVLHVPPTPEHWARSSGSWGLSGSVQRDSTGQGEPARLVDHVADSGSRLAEPSRHWELPVSAGRSPRHSSRP